MYHVNYTDGRPTAEFDSYEDALTAIECEYPDAETGHPGDISEGGDLTLCWACEDDSINDDGAKAVAAIRKIGFCVRIVENDEFICLVTEQNLDEQNEFIQGLVRSVLESSDGSASALDSEGCLVTGYDV